MNPEWKVVKLCRWCAEEFYPEQHNQIYCSKEHSYEAAKKSTLARYYSRKELKLSIHRSCAECGRTLSQYNDQRMCASCEDSERKQVITKRKVNSVIKDLIDR